MSYELTASEIFSEIDSLADDLSLPVAWPNIQFSATPSVYLKADLMWIDPVSGVDAKISQPGIIQLSVVSPDGGGLIKSLEICSEIETYFNIGKQILDVSVIKVAIENAITCGGVSFQPVSIYFK